MKTWTLGLTSFVVSVCLGLSACGDDDNNENGGTDTGGSSSDGGTGSGDAGEPGSAGESSSTTGGVRSTGGSGGTSTGSSGKGSTEGGESTGTAGESTGTAGETSGQAGEAGTTGGMSGTGGSTGGGGEPSSGGAGPANCDIPECLLDTALITGECAPAGDCVSESVIDQASMSSTVTECYDNGIKTQANVNIATFQIDYSVKNADGDICYSFSFTESGEIEIRDGNGDLVATLSASEDGNSTIITCDGESYTVGGDCPSMGEGGAGNIPTEPPDSTCVEGTCEF